MLDKKIRPMLAFSSAPFDSKDHIYEIKWDGTRCILFFDGKHLRLQNRRLLDITYRYPEFSSIFKEIKARDVILDGEIVVFTSGKPDFERLQRREHLFDPLRIKILSERIPATYIAFDLLWLNGKSYLDYPLIERKGILHEIISEPSFIIESRYVEEFGLSFFHRVVKEGFEGIMAKAKMSPYLIGKRSRYWLKIKPRKKLVCHIIGFKKGKNERLIGSFLIGTLEGKKWLFRGRVGSGITEEVAKYILSKAKQVPASFYQIEFLMNLKDVQFIEPAFMCEVEFFEITEKGFLRGPVFKGLVDE